MDYFAGIVPRRDLPVPEEWVQTLAAAFADKAPTLLIQHADRAVFIQRDTALEPLTAAGAAAVPGLPTLLQGELHNREALRAELGTGDVGDADLIAALLARSGAASVARLRGEFALAHWPDGSDTLLLARDVLGHIPIYYIDHADFFVFSTHLRVLPDLPLVAPALCEVTLVERLCLDGSTPADATAYASIRLLPAAHYLQLRACSVDVVRYWAAEACAPLVLPSDDEYAERLLQHLSAAVDRSLLPGRRIAVHLSGGLDSSSIACLAARSLKRQGRRLLALCSVLPAAHAGPEVDERVFIQQVLEQEDNIDVVWVEPAPDFPLFGALQQRFEALGSCPYSTVTHIEDLLGRMGREHGIDVVLSGFAGDLIVSTPGYRCVSQLLRQRQWSLAWQELKALRQVQRRPWPRLLRQEVFTPLLPLRLQRQRAARRVAVAARADVVRRVSERRGTVPRASTSDLVNATTREIMCFVAAPGHLERILADTRQWYALEFGQQLRFPLLDQNLLELMLGMPCEQFRKDGWTRSLLRRAMRGILPESIRLRTDKGGAFDPGITSRAVLERPQLTRWALQEHVCWRHIDRDRFLTALAALEPGRREQWQQEFFQIIIMGGMLAHFLNWHAERYENAHDVPLPA